MVGSDHVFASAKGSFKPVEPDVYLEWHLFKAINCKYLIKRCSKVINRREQLLHELYVRSEEFSIYVRVEERDRIASTVDGKRRRIRYGLDLIEDWW